jgi:integrase
MLKNVTLLDSQKDGKATWRLLGPNGLPLDSFSAFADSLIRKHAFNTRLAYCRHLADFLDYLFEAAAALTVENPGQRFTRALLRRVIEAYDAYLVFGGSSGNEIARLVNSSRPSPRHSATTSALMHAPLRKFLKVSEALRMEMEEMTREGLRSDVVDPQPLLPDLTAVVPVSGPQRQAMAATSMIAGVISGGPKLLHSAVLPTVSPQVAYQDSRAFPYDAIGKFIDQLPTYRDKTLHSFMAASGCRCHEALQLLMDDINFDEREVALRDPSLRPNHPSYLALRPEERDRLAWKGRTTERTLLIEPFAQMFFVNMEHYLRTEYIPHGQHRFLFQYLRGGMEGRPYFLSAASSRLQVFKRAAADVGVEDQVHGPHSLRHAYGTYLLNYFPRINGDYGLPLSLVRQLMGHANVKSTMKYARHDEELLRIELQHANAMVFNGAEPKPLLQLKLEALNSQVRKLSDILGTSEGSAS